MAALIFRSAATAFDESGVPTSLDCSVPGSTAENDLMIAGFFSMSVGAPQVHVLPDGWNVLRDETMVIFGYGCRIQMLSKIAGPAEPGLYAFSVGNPAIELSAVIVSYVGAYLTDPIKPRIELTAGQSTVIQTTNLNTDANDSTLIALVVNDNFTGGATSVSDDMTKRAEPSGHFALFDRYQPVRGPSGNFTLTASGGTGTHRVLMASVRTQIPILVPLGVRLKLHNGVIPRVEVTDISTLWWDTPAPTNFGAPVYVLGTQSTDADGVITVDLSTKTSLQADSLGFLLLFKEQAVATSDLVFAGRLPVQEIM